MCDNAPMSGRMTAGETNAAESGRMTAEDISGRMTVGETNAAKSGGRPLMALVRSAEAGRMTEAVG